MSANQLPKEFRQKHLLGIKDLTRNDIELVFETADNFKAIINRPSKKVPSLRDI
ncbi:MAG: aspartate carbamoyltransferase, partial [Bacteroidota bacterium]